VAAGEKTMWTRKARKTLTLDGTADDLSDQTKASLSLRGIDPGSNENVKVMRKGTSWVRGGASSSLDVSLTGTSESSMKGKTAFSSLATSLLNEKAVRREENPESYVAADDESELEILGHFRGERVPWRSYPASNRHNTRFDKLFG
jgi:calcium/calmodulin-dependent protein kinase I